MHRHLRTFLGKMEFMEFSRLCKPCVNLLLKAHIDWLAREQALEGALVVGQEKEG